MLSNSGYMNFYFYFERRIYLHYAHINIYCYCTEREEKKNCKK